jgi:hypothetical protein
LKHCRTNVFGYIFKKNSCPFNAAGLMFLVLFKKRITLSDELNPCGAHVFGFLKKNSCPINELKPRRANVFGSFFKKNSTKQRIEVPLG